MMNEAQTYLKEIDATPKRFLIDAYNQHVSKNNTKYQLVVNDSVRPCFFSGNLEEPGKIASISLNPAYEPGKTEAAPGPGI